MGRVERTSVIFPSRAELDRVTPGVRHILDQAHVGSRSGPMTAIACVAWQQATASINPLLTLLGPTVIKLGTVTTTTNCRQYAAATLQASSHARAAHLMIGIEDVALRGGFTLDFGSPTLQRPELLALNGAGTAFYVAKPPTTPLYRHLADLPGSVRPDSGIDLDATDRVYNVRFGGKEIAEHERRALHRILDNKFTNFDFWLEGRGNRNVLNKLTEKNICYVGELVTNDEISLQDLGFNSDERLIIKDFLRRCIGTSEVNLGMPHSALYGWQRPE